MPLCQAHHPVAGPSRASAQRAPLRRAASMHSTRLLRCTTPLFKCSNAFCTACMHAAAHGLVDVAPSQNAQVCMPPAFPALSDSGPSRKHQMPGTPSQPYGDRPGVPTKLGGAIALDQTQPLACLFDKSTPERVVAKMNSLYRAAQSVVRATPARGFASASFPKRKVTILGAAGELCTGVVRRLDALMGGGCEGLMAERDFVRPAHA